MSKQINFNVNAERFSRDFGRSADDAESAFNTINSILDTFERLDGGDKDKLFTNLPYTAFRNALDAFNSGKRGLLAERYYARQIGATVTNEKRRGDLTDGYGKRIEVKMSNRCATNGLFQFTGIRPKDQFDELHLLCMDKDIMVVYRIDMQDIPKLSLHAGRNDRDNFNLGLTPGGKTDTLLREIGTTVTFDDSTTGRRANAFEFLNEAGLQTSDLNHLVEVKGDIEAAVSGIGTVGHVELSELMAIQPLVERNKFGLLVQDWLTDHLEIATNRIPGRGDGVGRTSKVEIKYSSISTTGAFRIYGVKPSEFDELYLVLNFGDRIEFFKLNRREAKYFTNPVKGYGRETNDGIYSVAFGSKTGKALRYLKRKKINLNTGLH